MVIGRTQININKVIWKQNKVFLEDKKIANRKQKTINGNINKTFRVGHWNGGSKYWVNKKLELENLLEEQKPDLLFLSEANLGDDVPIENRRLEGHKIILPLTMQRLGYARIVLIVKQELEVEPLDDLMDHETASIWVKLGERKNCIVVGGLYSEFRQPRITAKDANRMEIQRQQENRWKKIIIKSGKKQGNILTA